MITFKEFLNEHRLQYLYHGTSLENAKKIIQSKQFKGETWHYGDNLLSNKKYVYGISTSRSYNRIKYGIDGNYFSVIFIIDPIKVKQRFKVTPVDYYGKYPGSQFENDTYKYDSEFEEFIRTNSLPLNVLTKIIIFDEYYDDVETKIINYIKKKSPVPVVMEKR